MMVAERTEGKKLPFVFIIITTATTVITIKKKTLVITAMTLQLPKITFPGYTRRAVCQFVFAAQVEKRGGQRRLPRQQRYSGNGSADNARVKNDLHSTQKTQKNQRVTMNLRGRGQ